MEALRCSRAVAELLHVKEAGKSKVDFVHGGR